MGCGDKSPPADLKAQLCTVELPDTPPPGHSRCVKSWIQKHSVLIICLLVGALIGFFVFLAVYLRTCPPVPPACPNKWTRSNEKCFFVSQATKDWNSSLEFCKSDGGMLLPAGNEMLQEIGSLYNLVGNDYWIGLNKDKDSGEWKQLNGSVWPWPIKHDHPKMSCSCVNSGEYVALDCSTSRHWICVQSL
ncbi:killer cell lectin-like receptor subfamily B member 1A isoform X1 [Ranitomeya variabilis]|uniref:killer cell lectin-like receptor subfamily B member 1A isoform X1 n=1 Tax=Ranitomeya variabilis TaxID=490064 RepID=UPI004055D1DB